MFLVLGLAFIFFHSFFLKYAKDSYSPNHVRAIGHRTKHKSPLSLVLMKPPSETTESSARFVPVRPQGVRRLCAWVVRGRVGLGLIVC